MKKSVGIFVFESRGKSFRVFIDVINGDCYITYADDGVARYFAFSEENCFNMLNNNLLNNENYRRMPV